MPATVVSRLAKPHTGLGYKKNILFLASEKTSKCSGALGPAQLPRQRTVRRARYATITLDAVVAFQGRGGEVRLSDRDVVH